MSSEMTDMEIIDSLLRTTNALREQVKSLEEMLEIEKSSSKLALEGLSAINEYGDSQEIASKTIQQIKDLEKK